MVALTPEEVRRAIFIDYEGNTDKPPTLLGWRVDGRTMAAIVEPLFNTCANRYRARNVKPVDHVELALELVGQAERENRKIVGWSEHDLKVMQSVLEDTDGARLRSVYGNAIKTARPWHRSERGALPRGEATLDYFSKLLGFHVPEKYGLGLVGDGLRLITEQLKEGRDYPALTKAARQVWVKVVKHNRLDLEAMEFVLLRIAYT